MSISAISGLGSLKGFESGSAASMGESSGAGQTSFSKFLENSIGDVNQMLGASDKKQMEIASGRSENLHDAMITFEKAETALKLLVQVRNKAMDAYHEILRMQV